MHLLQNQLPSDLMQCEITQRIVGYIGMGHFLNWDTEDVINSLKAGFQISYSDANQLLQTNSVITEMLEAVGTGAKPFDILPRLDNEFKVCQVISRLTF